MTKPVGTPLAIKQAPNFKAERPARGSVVSQQGGGFRGVFLSSPKGSLQRRKRSGFVADAAGPTHYLSPLDTAIERKKIGYHNTSDKTTS